VAAAVALAVDMSMAVLVTGTVAVAVAVCLAVLFLQWLLVSLMAAAVHVPALVARQLALVFVHGSCISLQPFSCWPFCTL
jgi:hypothetical protein